ncbi:hypothetical protein TWF106_006703 [Orbilia oligospora]|uniref:Uncharacterized protein n=1 Tax=Orbilia oligospora TaxID=2813651 RepID=A0A7C8Q591_ORBOL|nr:hypothetical protein TWF106_006703 [Orbilia oligospora]KAF3197653.1 hypothetical protein TWF679_011478 [Orbilia oligospora]
MTPNRKRPVWRKHRQRHDVDFSLRVTVFAIPATATAIGLMVGNCFQDLGAAINIRCIQFFQASLILGGGFKSTPDATDTFFIVKREPGQGFAFRVLQDLAIEVFRVRHREEE